MKRLYENVLWSVIDCYWLQLHDVTAIENFHKVASRLVLLKEHLQSMSTNFVTLKKLIAMMSTQQQKACMHVFVVAEWHRHNFLFNLREFIKSTFQICFPDINCHHTSKQKYVCLKICFCLPMK